MKLYAVIPTRPWENSIHLNSSQTRQASSCLSSRYKSTWVRGTQFAKAAHPTQVRTPFARTPNQDCQSPIRHNAGATNVFSNPLALVLALPLRQDICHRESGVEESQINDMEFCYVV